MKGSIMNELAQKLTEVYTANDLAIMYTELLSKDELIEESFKWGVLSKQFTYTTYTDDVVIETKKLNMIGVNQIFNGYILDQLDDLNINASYTSSVGKSTIDIKRIV